MKTILPSLYALVVVAAMIYMYANAPVANLSGVYAILATLPWSLLIPKHFPGALPGVSLIVVSALINCGLLCLVGCAIDRVFSNTRPRANS